MVKFVIVWLVAVYIFEVVRQANWYVGFGGVVVAALVNVYARRRAAAAVETNFAFQFWLYVPVVLLFGLPMLFNVVRIFTGEQEQTWWDYLVTLLPFILRLGVPVVVLIWVYVALGKLRPQGGKDVEPTA